MKNFQDTFPCACGNAFEWKYEKLENGEIAVFKESERLLNCKDFVETAFFYCIQIKCPFCRREHLVEIKK